MFRYNILSYSPSPTQELLVNYITVHFAFSPHLATILKEVLLPVKNHESKTIITRLPSPKYIYQFTYNEEKASVESRDPLRLKEAGQFKQYNSKLGWFLLLFIYLYSFYLFDYDIIYLFVLFFNA